MNYELFFSYLYKKKYKKMEAHEIDATGMTFEKVWFTLQAISNENREETKNLKEMIRLMNLETDKKMQETSKKMQETSKKMQETDKYIQETARIVREMSIKIEGISDSNGDMAEFSISSALQNNLRVGDSEYDYMDTNLKRKHKKSGIEAEYDIILYNTNKVLIIEVKYNFKEKYLSQFYKNLKNFKLLFPEHKNCELYGAVAGLSFEKSTLEEAKKYGFYILTQDNKNLKLLNELDFEPQIIK